MERQQINIPEVAGFSQKRDELYRIADDLAVAQEKYGRLPSLTRGLVDLLDLSRRKKLAKRMEAAANELTRQTSYIEHLALRVPGTHKLLKIREQSTDFGKHGEGHLELHYSVEMDGEKFIATRYSDRFAVTHSDVDEPMVEVPEDDVWGQVIHVPYGKQLAVYEFYGPNDKDFGVKLLKLRYYETEISIYTGNCLQQTPSVSLFQHSHHELPLKPDQYPSINQNSTTPTKPQIPKGIRESLKDLDLDGI